MALNRNHQVPIPERGILSIRVKIQPKMTEFPSELDLFETTRKINNIHTMLVMGLCDN